MMSQRGIFLRFDARQRGIRFDWLTPIGAQIKPRRIGRDDELKFANTEPAFELLLAGDRRSNGGESLEIDEVANVVLGGVAVWVFLLLMLPNTDFEFSSDADVEFLETVGQDINIGVFAHDTSLFPYLTTSSS